VIAGGVLTSAAGWAWVFFINVPIGLVVLLAVPVVIPAGAGSPGRRRIDGPGAVTVTAATGAAIYGLVNAGSYGWGSASALVPIGVAAVLYGAFGRWERRTAHPLIDPRALRQRAMAVGAFLMLIATGLLVGAFFLGSFYLQRVRGFSALATGLAFLPVAVAAVAGAHTGGRLVASRDRRALSAAALAVTAVGAAVAAAAVAWHSPVVLIAGMSIAALGIGATLVTATTTALADVPPGEAGVRSGLVSTFHEFGSALGVAILSTLAASSVAAVGPGTVSLTGFTRAFAASAIVALAAAVTAAVLAPPGKAVPGASPMAH
jgi:MFS family permease